VKNRKGKSCGRAGARTHLYYSADKLTTGTISGAAIHLLATSDNGHDLGRDMTLKDQVITGNAIETDPNNKDDPSKYKFIATRR
jgi:hypothetical protein